MFEKTIHWRRKQLAIDRISESVWHSFFKAAEANPAILENSDKLFTEFLKIPGIDIDTLLDRYSPPKLQPTDLERIIQGSLDDEVQQIQDPEKRFRYLMGQVMDKCRGHIPAKIVMNKVYEFVHNQKESV